MTDLKRYFLKCKECGFLTEILNENHTWCYNCTKRFDNYYKGWQPENGEKNLENYKKSICIAYSDLDIKLIVIQNNKKTEITEPTKEQIKRRAYIKEGIPLDRGGHYEWDFNQLKMFFLWILIIFGGLFLIVYLINLFTS